MRTILVFLTLLIMTPVFGLMVIVAALFGVKDRRGKHLRQRAAMVGAVPRVGGRHSCSPA